MSGGKARRGVTGAGGKASDARSGRGRESARPPGGRAQASHSSGGAGWRRVRGGRIGAACAVIAVAVAIWLAQRPDGAPPRAPPAAQLQVEMREVDRLFRELRATVVAPDGRRLPGARVLATADHVEMPGMHPVGPVRLEPADEPGVYRGTIGPLMYGDWKVVLTVSGPANGRFERVVNVPPPPARR